MLINTMRPALNFCAIAFIATVVLPATSACQHSSSKQSASDLLAHVEANAEKGTGSLGNVLRNPGNMSAPRVDSLLTGLETLALTSRSELVRQSAASSLTQAGIASNARPGSTGRAISVYNRSTDALVRRTILSLMHLQSERTVAVAFLTAVATKAGSDQAFEEESLVAVSTLANVRPGGSNRVLALLAEGRLRDPAAKGFAEWLAKQP